MLNTIQITDFTCLSGAYYPQINISYQIFGQSLDSGAPIVLVCHALTGNSNVCGEKNGWWRGLISQGNTIDTDKYCVLGINIPGNGYDGLLWGGHYADFCAADIARLFVLISKQLHIKKLHTVIGCSLGGCIAWEIAVQYPNYFDQLVVVAADWKATDWLLGLCAVQMQLLDRGGFGMHDARMMSMMFFRSPISFRSKFDREQDKINGLPKVESWLKYHGKNLEGRFTQDAYRFLTHLVSTSDIAKEKTFEQAVEHINGRIIQIGVDSDIYFQPYENVETHQALLDMQKDSHYKEIKSPHGHDSFLIEFEQLQKLLAPFFLIDK